jgi:3-keto-5-aminohexanoate cleavage enzyme
MGFALFFGRDGRGMMLSNPRAQIEWYAREMLERGVKPEYEIYNATMIEELELLVDKGLAPEPLNLGLVLGTAAHGGARGTWQNLVDMARRVPAGANVDVIAIGRAQLPLTTMGLAMGLGIRVGLEDNVRYNRTELARDNAQLVERAVRIARELQLEPASPAKARERLGTRGREWGSIPTPVVPAEAPVVPAPE